MAMFSEGYFFTGSREDFCSWQRYVKVLMSPRGPVWGKRITVAY
jgi:hypothetical protein